MQQAFHTLWGSNQLAPSPALLWSGAALTLSVLAPGIHYATPSQCECVLAAGRQRATSEDTLQQRAGKGGAE